MTVIKFKNIIVPCENLFVQGGIDCKKEVVIEAEYLYMTYSGRIYVGSESVERCIYEMQLNPADVLVWLNNDFLNLKYEKFHCCLEKVEINQPDLDSHMLALAEAYDIMDFDAMLSASIRIANFALEHNAKLK
jgi:hypothetical protein